MPPERTFVRMTNVLNKLTEAMKKLAMMMDDGIGQGRDDARMARVR